MNSGEWAARSSASRRGTGCGGRGALLCGCCVCFCFFLFLLFCVWGGRGGWGGVALPPRRRGGPPPPRGGGGGNRGGVCAEGDALQVRAGHVDAADSWAKEGDAKRLHNRPCGRSLGKVLGRVVVVSTGHRERVNTRALVVGREINAEAEGNAKKTQNEKRKRRKKQTTFKLV